VTPTVILLHGLARRAGSLRPLARRLEAAGYPTWARSYPSRRTTIAGAAAALTEQIVAELGDRPLAAVTHSMGGVIVRHMHDPRLAWTRIVMLAPPNRGSRLAAALAGRPLYRWFYGPAGAELADPDAWPPPPAPVAVIAGTRARHPANPTSWVSGRALDEPSDGTVAVAETRLPEMLAFATVDATHTWIMRHPAAQALVLELLGAGR
jgi:pimeloyl-ACP methyl ester carboxylesterase